MIEEPLHVPCAAVSRRPLSPDQVSEGRQAVQRA